VQCSAVQRSEELIGERVRGLPRFNACELLLLEVDS
jgi:hypothetical protein